MVAAEEFRDGARRLLRRDGQSVALFSLKGTCYAIEDSCPHAGGSLVLGPLDGTMLQCPAHGLRFDLASGCQRGTAGLRVRTFPVRLNEGRIEVDLAPLPA